MDRVVAEELKLLEEVNTLLQEEPYVVPPSEGDLAKELTRLQKEIGHAKEEDKGAILEQFHHQSSLLRQLLKAREAPQVDPDCPYFAHIRLREGSQERDLCLGKATRIQRGVRIVDWRNAPVSRIFYRYQQGEEYEEKFGNRMVEGKVVARRTVAIQIGELRRIEAPEGIFEAGAGPQDDWRFVAREAPRLAGGEGTALRAHAIGEGSQRRLGTDLAGTTRRVDKHLPDIAGLLDPEQFDLITQPSSGFVVIRGMAGSGKTTVALHRIAWLAYNDEHINSPKTLFLVFSKALRDYVGHVLPALGVEKVAINTFGAWAHTLRKRHFPGLPRAVRQDTPSVVVRLKLHPIMMIALEEHIEQTPGRATAEQVLDDWASVATNPKRLKEIARQEATQAFSDAEIDRAARWCRERYSDLVAWQEGDKGADTPLDAEDEALLLRAWQLRVGHLRAKGRKPLRYRHVAIDEVQDLSPVEVRVLLDCLDSNQSITLAGDTQQHVMQNAGFTSWSDFFRHLGVEGTEVNTLRISYRSSKHIMDFAIALLGELREDEQPPLTTRQGDPVELFRFTDHGACVAFLADVLKELQANEPLASIVILSPTPNVSGMYYRGLQKGDVPNMRQVTDEDFSFSPGIEVTEIEQVKGLEFDYVILVEASARHFPDLPSNRRRLHVGATRAIHQLWVTSVGTPSPMVREILE